MLFRPWDFSFKTIGVGFDFLSQGNSPRIEPRSPAWQVTSLPLSHQGSPPWFSQEISTESLSGNGADSGAVIVIKRKFLSFWSLNSPGEVEKQANAYVMKSQCWYMQRRKAKQNWRGGELIALLIMGNMYWSVTNSSCTDSFNILNNVRRYTIYNYDITVLLRI